MAAARHNRPTIIIYGGTIQPGIRHLDCPSTGHSRGGTVNISDAFESFGRFFFLSYDVDVDHASLVKALTLLARLPKRSEWTSYVMHAPVPVRVLECIRKIMGIHSNVQMHQ
jgi:hypothetical protein